MAAKKLTAEETETIVRLRLNAVPVKQVAAEVGVTPAVVAAEWKRWLTSATEDRRVELEDRRSEVLERLQSVADNARRAAIKTRAKNPKGEAAFMAEERRALTEMARIAATSPDDVPDEEPGDNLLAAQAGDRKKALEQLRDTLANEIDTTDKQVHAQLSAQYRATLLELAEIGQPAGKREGIDELKQRRNQGRGATSDASANA